MTTVYEEVSPPIKGSAWSFCISLVSQANPNLFQTNPTLAVGDVKVQKDGGGMVNITTLPTAIESGKSVLVSLSASEMNGNHIDVAFSDVAGAEWGDEMFSFPTVQAVTVPSAVDIWATAGRTLTQSAAAVAAAMSGSVLAITRAVSFSATISGLTIPATWDKIYLTVKQSAQDIDSASVLQIVETAVPAATDGITYVNGVAATVPQRAYGSLTVNQAAGTIDIVIMDDGTLLTPVGSFTYDIKCLLADGTSQILSGSSVITVRYTETHTIA
jgi:hypothetical protein